MRIDFEITYRGETINLDETASQMVVSFTIYDGNFPNSSGGGAVDSVNGKTGTVVLNADDIAETSTRKWLTATLKGYYDIAYAWVNTNGASVLQSISDLTTALGNKVDKVTGYGLSKNDLTDVLKTAYDAVVTAMPLKANLTQVQCILSKMPSEVTLTTLSGEQILYTHHIPANTLSQKDILVIKNQGSKSLSAGITNLKIRVTEEAVPSSFTTAQILASYNQTSANTFIAFDRNRVFIKNDSTWLSVFTTTSMADDTISGSYQEKTFNRTVDLYIHITAQNVVTNDVLTLNSSVIFKL